MKRLVAIASLIHATLIHTCAVERTTIAILPAYNASGDTNLAYMEHFIRGMLESQMSHVQSIRVLHKSSVDYAFRELKLKPDQPLGTTELQKVGRVIEANRVMWSRYDRANQKWNLVTKVLDVATGQCAESLATPSSNCFDSISNSIRDILVKLPVTLTRSEEEYLNRPFTSSEEVFELMGHAFAESEDYKSVATVEAKLRKCISLDSQFATARQALAHVLILQNRFDEATDEANQAIKIRPDYATAHRTLV